MTDDLCSALSIGKSRVEVITEEIVYSKLCVHWVLEMLTDEHKSAREVIPYLSHWYDTGEVFLGP
jgi:hypothetical protein